MVSILSTNLNISLIPTILYLNVFIIIRIFCLIMFDISYSQHLKKSFVCYTCSVFDYGNTSISTLFPRLWVQILHTSVWIRIQIDNHYWETIKLACYLHMKTEMKIWSHCLNNSPYTFTKIFLKWKFVWVLSCVHYFYCSWNHYILETFIYHIFQISQYPLNFEVFRFFVSWLETRNNTICTCFLAL